MNKTILVSAVLTAAAVITANAAYSPFDEFSRKSKAELYGFGEYLTGWERTTFMGGDLSIKFDSAFGGGLGLGINLTDRVNLNTEFAVARLDIKGEGLGVTVLGDATVLRWYIGLDYNILKRRVTPLITGGVGIMHFNGDFGPGADFSETDFAGGVGGGVRWDITDHWFAKAVYRVNWTTLEDSDRSTMFHTVAVALGYGF